MHLKVRVLASAYSDGAVVFSFAIAMAVLVAEFFKLFKASLKVYLLFFSVVYARRANVSPPPPLVVW